VARVKFAAPLRRRFRRSGNLLWVGVRSNLPPLVEWVNEHPLPVPLDVLTNPEDAARPATAAEFGFRPDRAVTVHRWAPERHVAFAAKARAALDIKGSDFRSRHKPPAKAIDFLASGLPLAMNPDSSPAEHLAGLGFRDCSPLDTDRWLSEAYWNDSRFIGRQLRHDLTGPKVAARFLKIVEAGPGGRRCGSRRETSRPPRPWSGCGRSALAGGSTGGGDREGKSCRSACC
jgi:hypothetical protein